jgi:HK97 family phage major capsid protein
MNKRLQALLKRKAAAVERMKTIRAEAGDDIFTDVQTAAFNDAKAEAERVQAAIEQEQAAIEAERTLVLPDNARIESLGPRVQNDSARGFAHFGEYLATVRAAALRPSAVDERLMIGASASTYANESVGADGGFLVPPSYASEIFSVINSDEQLLARVRQIPVAGNEWKYPSNETTAHGTTGVQAYWDGEADTINQTKPVFKNGSIKLDRLTALCPVTEESLEDSAALGAWIQMEAGEKMAFKVTDAILNGNGAGMPLGLLSAPCLVTVPKETSQPTSTLYAENILKMFSRMPLRMRKRAAWVMNQDVEPLLPQMNIKVKNVAGSENVGGIALPPIIYTPPGANGNDYGMLLGRPIVITEASPALSSAGDVALIDFQSYIAITKGGVKADESMHFFFDQNMRAFRFVLRIGGQPWLSAPIGRKNGSNTLSCAVALGAR